MAVACCCALFLSSFVGFYAEARTSNSQEGIDLTVYRDHICLFRERKTSILEEGRGSISYSPVQSGIITDSVSLDIREKGDVKLLQMEYYPIPGREELSSVSVGSKVKLVRYDKDHPAGYFTEAKLLSRDGIYKIGRDIYLGHPGDMVLSSDVLEGENLPRILWEYDNDGPSGKALLDIRYLTQGVGWKAHYSMVIGTSTEECVLDCLAVIFNRTRIEFKEANVGLVAGDIGSLRKGRADRAHNAKALFASAPEVSSRPVFGGDMHLYEVPFTLDLKPGIEKRVNLFSSEHISARKEYRAGPGTGYMHSRHDIEKDIPVDVFYVFTNDPDNGLGVPMPAGAIELYERTGSGRLTFAGADTVERTPEGEKVEITTGRAFDISVKRTRQEFKQVAKELFESSWRIRVRNSSEDKKKVFIRERPGKEWKVLRHSIRYEKLDSDTIQFVVDVPAKSEKEIFYSVRYGS
jgi:hypothetical protein